MIPKNQIRGMAVAYLLTSTDSLWMTGDSTLDDQIWAKNSSSSKAIGRHLVKRSLRLVSTTRVVLIRSDVNGGSGYLLVNQTTVLRANRSSVFLTSEAHPFQGGDFFRGELHRSTVSGTRGLNRTTRVVTLLREAVGATPMD